MSTAMDNLLKMFKVARETQGESLGTAPSTADVEALPVHSTILGPSGGKPKVDFDCEGDRRMARKV